MIKHVIEKNGRYYYRRKVSKSLHKVFGMKEFSATLETGNKREAAQLEASFTPKFDAAVTAAKRNLLAGMPDEYNEDLVVFLNRELYALIHPDRDSAALNAIFQTKTKPIKIFTLAEYVDEFLKYCEQFKKNKQTTLNMYTSVLKVFCDQVNVTFVYQLTTKVLNDFDVFMRNTNTGATITQKYTVLISFFKYLQKNKSELTEVTSILGVLTDLRANAPDSVNRREAFSDDELRQIFGDSYAKFCKSEEYYFIGLLSLTLGLRPMELVKNVKIGDIKKDVDEAGEVFIYLDLIDRVNSLQQSSLKTTQSARKIPLSKKWVFFKEFVDFYERRKRTSGVDSLLFSRSLATTGKKMNSLLKLSGVKDTGKVFYSLRHNYTQILRDAGVHPYTIDYLTGHKGSGITQTEYAKHFNIRRLHEEIRKCDKIFLSLLARLKLFSIYQAEKTGDIFDVIDAYAKYSNGIPRMDELLTPEEYEKYLDYNERHNYVIESEPEKQTRSTLDEQIDKIFD